MNELPYVIINYSVGYFAGHLKSKNGKEVILLNARRLWKFAGGVASLSQLATEGISNPDACEFTCELPKIIITEAIEIIECTEKAMLSIKSVINYEEKAKERCKRIKELCEERRIEGEKRNVFFG